MAPQTRMLLASDGSTTILLQALVGERLRLRLDAVDARPADDVSAPVRDSLGIRPESTVLVRRSALVTGTGAEVARNVVIGSPAAVPRLLTSSEPIGATMNHSRAGHRRLRLDAGSSTWETAEGPLRCAFKAYLILDGGVPVLHIVERFNPAFVPPIGARAGVSG